MPLKAKSSSLKDDIVHVDSMQLLLFLRLVQIVENTPDAWKKPLPLKYAVY